PSLQKSTSARGKTRIWSAACSSGQEPYSIAIALAEKRLHRTAKVRILCTDINSQMVKRTRSGTFHTNELRGLPDGHRLQWFDQIGSDLVVKDELRNLMLCNKLNLFGQWPFAGPVDVIFCRNALIYFNRDIQSQLIRRFAAVQDPGGFLYLGHSESVHGIKDYYERMENTVYRRLT
ncbi:MAG: CheR family methyltransferase, partial [Pseudomonadota bacterium]